MRRHGIKEIGQTWLPIEENYKECQVFFKDNQIEPKSTKEHGSAGLQWLANLIETVKVIQRAQCRTAWNTKELTVDGAKRWRRPKFGRSVWSGGTTKRDMQRYCIQNGRFKTKIL